MPLREREDDHFWDPGDEPWTFPGFVLLMLAVFGILLVVIGAVMFLAGVAVDPRWG